MGATFDGARGTHGNPRQYWPPALGNVPLRRTAARVQRVMADLIGPRPVAAEPHFDTCARLPGTRSTTPSAMGCWFGMRPRWHAHRAKSGPSCDR